MTFEEWWDARVDETSGPVNVHDVRAAWEAATKAEREAIDKDAARYRWLQSQPMYPTWKAIAAVPENKRNEVIDAAIVNQAS